MLALLDSVSPMAKATVKFFAKQKQRHPVKNATKHAKK